MKGINVKDFQGISVKDFLSYFPTNTKVLIRRMFGDDDNRCYRGFIADFPPYHEYRNREVLMVFPYNSLGDGDCTSVKEADSLDIAVSDFGVEGEKTVTREEINKNIEKLKKNGDEFFTKKEENHIEKDNNSIIINKDRLWLLIREEINGINSLLASYIAKDDKEERIKDYNQYSSIVENFGEQLYSIITTGEYANHYDEINDEDE